MVFSFETETYIRVREVMEAAFDNFLEKKHKQKLDGIYVPERFPKAENADLVSLSLLVYWFM